MKVTQFSAAVVCATLLFTVSASALSWADGMPFKNSKPQPILTPLDQALTDIQEPPPTELKKEEPVPEAAPVVVEKKEPPAPPPVPESRVVSVQPNTSFFGLSVGMYDPFSHGKTAASFNVEWQPGVKIAGTLQPLFGAMLTTNGAMMGYGGVGVPVHLSKRILLMPSVAVGAYHEGRGYDLDRTLAFRVGTELAYEFDDQSRLGLNAHILTNGTSLDRSDRTEVISLVYTTPMNFLAGPVRKMDMPVAAPATQAPAPEIAKPAAETTTNTGPAVPAAPAEHVAPAQPLND